MENQESLRVPECTSKYILYLMAIRGSLNVVVILKNKILSYNKKQRI